MPRALPRMDLTDDERRELEAVVAAPTSQQRAALRARIVLLADKGQSTIAISKTVGVTTRVVVKWRSRFARQRAAGLADAPGRGRPRVHGADIRLKIATEACRPPEGTSHWSTRDLAAHIGVPHVLVHRVLKAESIKPHLQEMWLNSKDPEFERKEAEIVGLYLNPPENALVICVDEKTGMQALGRKYPDKPVKPGKPARREFEYVRYGTQSLLAALCVSDGSVTGKCYDRHTHEEFLDFLHEIAARFPEKELHLIVDNLSVHKHDKVAKWLESNERVHFHFTPTHASWLNQIEIWFSILGVNYSDGASSFPRKTSSNRSSRSLRSITRPPSHFDGHLPEIHSSRRGISLWNTLLAILEKASELINDPLRSGTTGLSGGYTQIRIKVVVPDDQINDVYDGLPIFRHFHRDNLGFFDGHSKALLPQQFYGIVEGVGIPFVPNQNPVDYWFCADRTNLAQCQTPAGQ